MFSNSVLISWRVRAVHLFRKVIFVKMEFVEHISALFDYLRYIKEKRVCQVLLAHLCREAVCYPVNLVQRVYPGIFLCVSLELFFCEARFRCELSDNGYISVPFKPSDFIGV